jgi:RNA polymerase sigma factor (sigma-70 family)
MSPRFSCSEAFLRTQSDARLCALAGDDQPLAFKVLVERHRAGLIRTAARVGGMQRADDAVQEALLRAWSTLRSGTQVRNVSSWLHTIVHNTTLNQIARERGPTEPLPDELADTRRLDDRLPARDLLAHIAALPERQRTALVESALGGRSRHEIAGELGVSEGAVRQLVHRARGAVRTAMTAITPYPLAAWVARRGSGLRAIDRLQGIVPPTTSGRSSLLETLAAGSTAGGGALLKGGAVLIAAGALGGGVAWHELSGAHHRSIAAVRRERAVPRPPVATRIAIASPGVAAGPRPPDTISGAATLTHPPRSRHHHIRRAASSDGKHAGASGDRQHELAAEAPPTTVESSTGTGDAASQTPVAGGSTTPADRTGPSPARDSVSGSGTSSGTSSSGAGSDSASGTPVTTSSGAGSDSASGTASGSADSSSSSVSDVTGASGTTTSGGDN